jgi:hypothetical protein
MEPARIAITDKGARFEQGSISFEVDRYDIMKVLGAGNWYDKGSVLDHLSDATLVTLAIANDLPVEPYSRELLRSPLHGVIMLTWYRDVEKRELSESLIKNHSTRVEKYRRDLDTLRQRLELDPDTLEVGHKPRRVARLKLTRRYRLGKKIDPATYGGQEAIILKIVQKLGEPTFADIIRAAEKEIKTKLKLNRVITYRVNHAVQTGALELIEQPLKIKK